LAEKAISLMKKTALIINSARGGLVDEIAVVKALRQKRLGGAAFDVLSKEPPQDNNPLLQALDLPNLLVTPHIAWASQQSRQRLVDQLGETIGLFLEGKPRNIVS